MLIASIPQYIQGITNAKVDLTTTNNTTLYTVPTDADFNASVVNSIIVHDDSNNGDTLTVTITDASANVFQIFEKTVSGHATEELLTRDLILQSGEILKVQAVTANRLHVVASIQEFSKTRITTSAITQIL
jgi:phosphoribosylaminoimidazole-succinocarboxamide synthase